MKAKYGSGSEMTDIGLSYAEVDRVLRKQGSQPLNGGYRCPGCDLWITPNATHVCTSTNDNQGADLKTQEI